MSLMEFINVLQDVKDYKVGIVFNFKPTGEMVCKRYTQSKDDNTQVVGNDEYVFSVEELFGEFRSSVSKESFIMALEGLLKQASFVIKTQSDILKKESEINEKLTNNIIKILNNE